MNRKLGLISIVAAAFIYTIERGFSIMLYGARKMSVAVMGGGTSGTLRMPSLFENLFVPLLFLIGIALLSSDVLGFGSKNSNQK